MGGLVSFTADLEDCAATERNGVLEDQAAAFRNGTKSLERRLCGRRLMPRLREQGQRGVLLPTALRAATYQNVSVGGYLLSCSSFSPILFQISSCFSVYVCVFKFSQMFIR